MPKKEEKICGPGGIPFHYNYWPTRRKLFMASPHAMTLFRSPLEAKKQITSRRSHLPKKLNFLQIRKKSNANHFSKTQSGVLDLSTSKKQIPTNLRTVFRNIHNGQFLPHCNEIEFKLSKNSLFLKIEQKNNIKLYGLHT